MKARDVISLMAIYIAIYYFNARSLLSWIRDSDKEYSERLGLTGGIGLRNSIEIVKILFDRNLPKPNYPDEIKFRLKFTRLMLFLSPVITICIALLID